MWLPIEGYSPARWGPHGRRSLRPSFTLHLPTGRTSMAAGDTPASVFPLSTEPRIIEGCCPPPEWVILLQFNSCRNFLTAVPRLITYVILDPTKWTTTISHHIVHFINIRIWVAHAAGWLMKMNSFPSIIYRQYCSLNVCDLHFHKNGASHNISMKGHTIPFKRT